MEKFRPTPEQIENAKQGSNDLFNYDVPEYLQPNNLRHSDNIGMYHGGFINGVYYHHGVPQQPKEKE